MSLLYNLGNGRDIYEATIRKSTSVKHRKYVISMIIDAAGGNGATYYPRFRTIEKSEPHRHEPLKTKITFAIVHCTRRWDVHIPVISRPRLSRRKFDARGLL